MRGCKDETRGTASALSVVACGTRDVHFRVTRMGVRKTTDAEVEGLRGDVHALQHQVRGLWREVEWLRTQEKTRFRVWWRRVLSFLR